MKYKSSGLRPTTHRLTLTSNSQLKLVLHHLALAHRTFPKAIMTPIAMRPVRHLSRHCSVVDRRKAKASKRPELERRMSAPGSTQAGPRLMARPSTIVWMPKILYGRLASRDYLKHASEDSRAALLLAFVRTFAHHGAPLDVLETLAWHASGVFGVQVTLVRYAGTLSIFVGTRRRSVRIVCSLLRRSAPCGMGEVQRLYDAVVDQRVRVHEARRRLEHMCAKPAVRVPIVHVGCAAMLAGAVCWFALGGTPRDLLYAVLWTLVLGSAHLIMRRVNLLVAEVLEAYISFVLVWYAHSGARSTSPARLSILPGYLYLCCTIKHNTNYARTELFAALCASLYASALAHGLPVFFDVVLMSQVAALVSSTRQAWNLAASRSPMELVRC